MIRSKPYPIPSRIPAKQVESKLIIFLIKICMKRKLVSGVNGFISESFRQTLAGVYYFGLAISRF